MDIGIQFRLTWFDNDVLDLTVAAWNGAFGGVAQIYEAIGALRSLANQLRGFPDSPTDERKVEFGNFDRACAAGGIRMRFHCVGMAGHAYVEVTIDSNPVSRAPIQTAVLTMRIEAAAVDVFVEELERLEAQRTGVARLRGIATDT